MLERVLSMRRSSPHPDDAGDGSSVLLARHHHVIPCAWPVLLLFLAFVFLVPTSFSSLTTSSASQTPSTQSPVPGSLASMGWSPVSDPSVFPGDLIDFGSMDWKAVIRKHRITDLGRVLIFSDDHQNELKRLKQALKAGFRHITFEDNYDTGTGDHYSLRQICDQNYIRGGGHSCFKDSDEARIRSRRKKFWEKAVGVDELCGHNEAGWGVRGYRRDDFNHSNAPISYTQHFQNSRFLESVFDVYWELPPVAGSSLTHQSRYDPARTLLPIVEDGRYQNSSLYNCLGLGADAFQAFLACAKSDSYQ